MSQLPVWMSNETENLFRVLRKLKDEGLGIIFITHFIDQIYEVTDRVTVLRNGKLVGTYETAVLPRLELDRQNDRKSPW